MYDKFTEKSNTGVRKIIHLDMDAFFASVEQRDNPSLRGKPVVVGGKPDSRGVVAAASYEARQYGIHSAMPCSQAYRKCPQTIFVKPRFEAYKTVSRQIRAIFLQYTDIIEPLSLDEAYLDVTINNVEQSSATIIAEQIRSEIYQQTGLTASAGVSYNKFLAKTASDINKPNGIKVILPEEGEAFVSDLPIGKFYGIGKVTEKKMQQLGILTGMDLKEKSLEYLRLHFKNSASYFYNVSRGIDDRPVKGIRSPRKSLSNETTFAYDTDDLRELHDYLKQLAEEVSEDLQHQKLMGKTVTLKVKYDNFELVTRSQTFQQAINDDKQIYRVCKNLLTHTEAGLRKVRLLGVGLSLFNHQTSGQMQQIELDFDRH
ncbi:MAG: DNA polymerase IV [Gammaproteobacteria bacterium]|nr:MAG: DNA polymerase IV [Gammaproteobacteria bacterium]